VTPQPAKDKRVSPANASVPVDFPTIVERYRAAVVNISVIGSEQQAPIAAPAPIDSDDPLIEFVKRLVPQSQAPTSNPPRAIAGTGSGFIVSPDGLILTTAHVVDRADEVTVRLTDRREFKGKVLAVDTQSDVAVVQVDATKLPTVKLGDSSRVRVGEAVLTIGSPDRFENTVTAGIVSATVRTLPDGSGFPFFQTEVAANPDNSGGPLFNLAGEVVGIDVQIYADSDKSSSLTFAIPINLAVKVRSQVLALHATSPGGLGVEVQDVGPGLAVAFGLPRPEGALVNAVGPGTPAAAGGLKPGDVIIQMGDKTIGRSAELGEVAAALLPGTKTTLRLIRGRKAMTTTIMVGASAELPNARQNDSGGADRLGLTMHPLSDEERRATGLPTGLMVDAADGPAASAGIQAGDVVLSLNDTLVETQEDVAALEARAGKQVAVLIQRKNARSFVSVKAK
jgi:Do/DeqQ family serine protease